MDYKYKYSAKIKRNKIRIHFVKKENIVKNIQIPTLKYDRVWYLEKNNIA